MSADSPRRTGVHKGAQVVSPQPIRDKSIIDSVAGIIIDIVPQAYTSSAPNADNRESITWARFEYADVNDSAFYPDYNEGSSVPPLLLVLGYTTGVQVWLIAASGEATEVLSWRQGMVRTLRILPNPKCDDKEREDLFKVKRPMVAICDSAGPGPQFCSISFISLKTGEQVKSIKFKTPVCDVHANKRSIVVTFPERIAVFDAKTLEDVLTITTCYLSTGPNPNPVALGTRWLAYSEKKLIPGRRSSGGSEGEGVSSYTATVLYAAKSLGKGLRGLGETVASSLTGNSVSPMTTANNSNSSDATQAGVVTILDLQAAKEEKETDDANIETVVAHFTAHSDAIVAMTFDQTGALLMTADKRGHDFHVFRIQPHPGGPSFAAVHHLYVLHRGNTAAKVQDMTFSSDARWAAISTVRGTTHVFPVAPYGGPVGVRTHSSPHVVNRLSRFHKSAGLTDDGTRSHSPSHAELPLFVYPYTNPRLPPYPHPTILRPLAQIWQPPSFNQASVQAQPRTQQRQRLHSDDATALPLKICACFAPPRAWIYAQRDSANKLSKRAVDSLFIMACHGNMIQYDLEPKPAAGVPKEKICDKTPIELEVEAKGQWPLLRTTSSADIVPPLPPSSLLLGVPVTSSNEQQLNSNESRWLSQVEIFTHVGPHRRLWMGPQFVFKTYNAPSGVAANLVEAETVEVGMAGGSRPARSNPVNMPHATSRPLVPVVIDGSGSSYEQSPRFVEAYGDTLNHGNMGIAESGENQLREDLAEAMLETSSTPHRVAGRRLVVERVGHPVAKVVNPLGTVITVSADEEEALSLGQQDVAAAVAANAAACTTVATAAAIEDDDCPTSASSSSSSANPSTNICAEEGKLSGNGAEGPESGQTLREHTEICAEMRPANEPAAIDSVPDDSIEELKERRALCAEAASTASCCAVDLDRIGAFRDVPNSPSLCAERGAVPDCSNVVQQRASRLRSVVLAAYDAAEEAKHALGKELGYQMIEGTDTQERAALSIPIDAAYVAKSSTTCTSSDDDIEHIDKEELTATMEQPRKQQQPSSNALSSDDDIEHVLHCDISESEKKSSGAVGRNGRKRSKEKQRAAEVATEATTTLAPVVPVEAVKETKCPKESVERVDVFKEQEMELQQQQQQQHRQSQTQSSHSKKTRARSKRQPSISSASSDMVEIINMDADVIPAPELPSPPASAPAPPIEKFEEPLALPDMVEIIDIDAMERAEKSSGCFPNPPVPDCKILVGRPELAKKKSKRQKKQQQSQLLPGIQQQLLDNVDRAKISCEPIDKDASSNKSTEDIQQTSSSTNSWSSIVKRKSSSVSKTEEIQTSLSKPMLGVENVEDEEEANKENVDIGKIITEDNDDDNHDDGDDGDDDVVVEDEERIQTTGTKYESTGKREEITKITEKVGKVKQQIDEEPEKKSDSEQEGNGTLAERSSSSDDLNANTSGVVLMDTEEESSNGATHNPREQLLSALLEKNIADNDDNNGGSLMPSSALMQAGGALPAKKANRSKKKKRR